MATPGLLTFWSTNALGHAGLVLASLNASSCSILESVCFNFASTVPIHPKNIWNNIIEQVLPVHFTAVSIWTQTKHVSCLLLAGTQPGMPQQWRLGILADQCCSRCQCRQCLANESAASAASAASDSPCQLLLYRLTDSSTKLASRNNNVHRMDKRNLFPWLITNWLLGRVLSQPSHLQAPKTARSCHKSQSPHRHHDHDNHRHNEHHFIISSFHHFIISSSFCHHVIMASCSHVFVIIVVVVVVVVVIIIIIIMIGVNLMKRISASVCGDQIFLFVSMTKTFWNLPPPVLPALREKVRVLFAKLLGELSLKVPRLSFYK